jgi:hypothetical protein
MSDLFYPLAGYVSIPDTETVGPGREPLKVLPVLAGRVRVQSTLPVRQIFS